MVDKVLGVNYNYIGKERSFFMFNKLEKKFGRFAIKNLSIYIIILYGVGFFLQMMMPEVYYVYFALDAERILHGEVWRILTFLMNSPSNNILMLAISLYFYYILGTTLERAWGAFRFNIYYISGVLATVLASIIVYLVTGLSGLEFYMDTYYLNLSMMLAFATLMPNMRVLLMFIIPIKMKWIAYLDAAILIYMMIVGSWADRISILIALLNFLVYFFTFMRKRVSPKEIHRKYVYKKSYNEGQRSAMHRSNDSSHRGKTVITRHRCAVCGRTELDDENLEFRFCSKCNGNYEYCQDHLFTHTHVQ